jgi:oligoribonuclease NrnB/cAMP/cGMP phosphodiesterase (DHH superfamily)
VIGGLAWELQEARDRIKRLEDELMDMKNKHAVLVADVVLNEDRAERIKRVEEERRQKP